MNQNTIGLDIGTGSVKVATIHGTFAFPSIVARGKSMEMESKDIVRVGEMAVKSEQVKSMVLRTPVYRGAPTSIQDYLELIRHALDVVIKTKKDAIHQGPEKYSDCIIIAGIPYNAKEYSSKIKDAVNEAFAPKFFGVMFQAKATLDHEGISNGIVCHIGHGTTEIMAVAHGNIAHAQTIPHGVGDISNAITQSKTGYLNWDIFSKNTPEMTQQRKVLAAHISDVLEKTAIDYPNMPIICAGGGALIPKMIQDIKNDIITDITVAKNPVFSNALGMLLKASKCI